jgi:alcohol dehydrogenase (cytochrome c)
MFAPGAAGIGVARKGITCIGLAISLALAACTETGRKSTSRGVVSYERLRNAREDSSNWLTYSGDYDSKRFSALTQISESNAADLTEAWSLDLDTGLPVETTPLVVDETMYATRPPSDVLAINARTGELLWEFRWQLPDDMRPLCCGWNNRGVAMLGETIYVTTIDAHLVALDARTGSVEWDVEVADHRLSFNITAAPLAVKDMIVTGTSVAGVEGLSEAALAAGATKDQLTRLMAGTMEPTEVASLMAGLEKHAEAFWNGTDERRGRIDAYDAATGQLRWRFYTVPGAGEPGNETWEGDSWKLGAASPWLTGSYDPELDLLYWGTGNPAPALLDFLRKGDNLYATSVVALDPDNGSLRWYFQFTPHDRFDWDAAQIPVLADIEVGGADRKLLLTANRNSFFYSLDRSTGELLGAWPFAMQTWSDRRDSNGRPIFAEDIHPRVGGIRVAPKFDGGTNWWAPSYSPETGLFYVTAHDATENYDLARIGVKDIDYLKSSVRAIRPLTGEIAWEFELPWRSSSGILTTAGGLLFVGSNRGDFWALNAATGDIRWHSSLPGWIHAAPISYSIDGRQFVSIASSAGIHTFTLNRGRR